MLTADSATLVAGASILSSLIGGAIGAGSAYLGKRWDETAALRRAQGERLRHIYAPVAQATLVIRDVVEERLFTPPWISQEEMDRRHEVAMQDAMAKANEIGGALLVEPSSERIRSLFLPFGELANRFMVLEREPDEEPGRTDALLGLRAEIRRAADEIWSAVRSEIDDLEQPRRGRRPRVPGPGVPGGPVKRGDSTPPRFSG